MTHITRHVQIPTGYDSKGKVEFLTAGYLTEENFGDGNVRRRVWLHTSVLNPVLFQQVRPFVGKSSHVMLGHVDLRRKYRVEGAAEGQEPEESDAAQGVPTSEGRSPQIAEAVEKLRALMPGIPDAVADVRQANVFGQAIAEVIGLLGGGEVGGG